MPITSISNSSSTNEMNACVLQQAPVPPTARTFLLHLQLLHRPTFLWQQHPFKSDPTNTSLLQTCRITLILSELAC